METEALYTVTKGREVMTKDERQKLYTLRWYIRERWGEEHARENSLDILTDILEARSRTDERPSVSDSNQKLLWCPFAKSDFKPARSRGSYADGYPRGAVVHYTAGRRKSLEDSIAYQLSEGYLYFIIDADGNISQNFPLDSHGYHAGKSSYPGLSGSVSDELVGIEIQSAGLLKKKSGKYKSWFNTTIPDSEVRSINTKNENQVPGHYEKYTEAQEEALTELILWLYKNNPDIFSLNYVLGHDEISPGRKQDPGGCLSMTMPQFRNHLKELAAED